jgi:hypothetical protein
MVGSREALVATPVVAMGLSWGLPAAAQHRAATTTTVPVFADTSSEQGVLTVT